MPSTNRFLGAAALAGVALLAGGASVVTLDRGKRERIERSVHQVLNTAAPAGRPDLDYSKTIVIEPPVKALVGAGTAPAPARPGADFVNPKVRPGKVRWHATFADAGAAARKSKKPVLLFQLMGKLDDQFC